MADTVTFEANLDPICDPTPMHEQEPPDGIAFDYDGTLKNSVPLMGIVLNEIAAEKGLPKVTPEMTSTCAARQGDGMQTIWGISPEQEIEYQAIFKKKFFYFRPDFKMMPGALRFFDSVPKQIPVGIFTNCERGLLEADLAHLGGGRLERLKGIVARHETPKGKPSPDSLEKLVDMMGLKPDANIWVIGDADGDVIPGNLLRYRTILVSDLGYEGPKPWRRYQNIFQLHGNAQSVFNKLKA